MIQEQKELLLKDLCARLPYGLMIDYNGIRTTLHDVKVFQLYEGDVVKDYSCLIDIFGDDDYVDVENIRPYLFSLSSMTEEQEEELITITDGKFRYMCGDITNAIPRKNSGEWGISENAYIHDIKVINILYTWLLKNHFDINGLIPMGLAIDATGLNIY